MCLAVLFSVFDKNSYDSHQVIATFSAMDSQIIFNIRHIFEIVLTTEQKRRVNKPITTYMIIFPH